MAQAIYRIKSYVWGVALLIALIYGVKLLYEIYKNGEFVKTDIFIVFVALWWVINFRLSRWQIIGDELKTEWSIGQKRLFSKSLMRLQDVSKIDLDWSVISLYSNRQRVIFLPAQIENVRSLIREIISANSKIKVSPRVKAVL